MEIDLGAENVRSYNERALLCLALEMPQSEFLLQLLAFTRYDPAFRRERGEKKATISASTLKPVADLLPGQSACNIF